MLPWLASILIALVLLAILAGAVALYLPYWRSSLKRWRDEVLGLVAAARRAMRSAAAERQHLEAGRAREERALRDRALSRVLSSISVSELEAYSGIGPATVSKLAGAGFTSLASLQNARIDIHGLGEKRLTDIRNAVRDLTRQASSRLQAGSDPRAPELTAQLQAMSSRLEEADRRARAREEAAAGVLKQLAERAAAARRVNLWNFLWHDADTLVAEELRDAALPDLDKALRAADDLARRMGADRRRSAPGTEEMPAVIPVEPVAVPVSVPSDPMLRPEAATQPRPQKERRAAPVAAGPAVAVRAPTPPKDWHLLLMDLTVQFVCAVARTDGSISHAERDVIERELQRRFRYDPALDNRARALLAHYQSAAIDLEACLSRIQAEFEPPHCQALLDFACRVAEASGPMNRRERTFLEKIARQWGIAWTPPPDGESAPAQAEEREDVTPPPVPPPARPSPPLAATPPQAATREEQLALLEIEPSAPLSADLIRRRYHLLMERLDLDKVQAMGPEVVASVKGKREAVAAAARTLMEPFNEPLEEVAAPAPKDLRYNPDLDDVFNT
jgi:tellurite resistance protein